jgi:hypothetical protein
MFIATAESIPVCHPGAHPIPVIPRRAHPCHPGTRLFLSSRDAPIFVIPRSASDEGSLLAYHHFPPSSQLQILHSVQNDTGRACHPGAHPIPVIPGRAYFCHPEERLFLSSRGAQATRDLSGSRPFYTERSMFAVVKPYFTPLAAAAAASAAPRGSVRKGPPVHP